MKYPYPITSARPYKSLLLSLFLVLLSGCVEPYLPNVPAATQDYLVVNGFINSQGVTTIQLTRSLQLTDTKAPTPETRASVFIQANGGQRFALTESPAGSGTYTSASLTLNPGLTYQLRITTAGRDYASDLSPVKASPAIDQVHWRYENDGVQLYADTHDPGRATTYYRWKIAETWQFTSKYESHYQFNTSTQKIERRTNDIYHCWRTVDTGPVLQTSTARLSQDAVTDFPLVFIAGNSDKLSVKYSILVQQFAQSKEEYDYWEALKKNTESLGTINDPLPTQITGNVHCLTNPDEPVLGFVGVHAVAQQRIFISRTDVPQVLSVRPITGYENCGLLSENRCPPREPRFPIGVTYAFNTPVYLPLSTSCDTLARCAPLDACTYYGAAAECVDCRLRGTNVKPSFWQ
ncbi:MAG: DUF4249 domain-containing protein [Janthinobacterium lividum]